MLKKSILFLLFTNLLLVISCSRFSPPKTITIGIDTAFFGSQVGNKGALVHAFLLDLFEETLNKDGYRIKYQEISFGADLDCLKDQTCDFIVSSLGSDFRTNELYSFSDKALPLGEVFVTRKDMPTTFKGYGGKIIALPYNNNLVRLFSKHPNVTLTHYLLIPQALNDIVIFLIDGALIPYLSLSSHLSLQMRPYLNISSIIYSDTALRLVSLKDKHRSTQKTFNKGLSSIKNDGTYQKLLEKWNLTL